MQPPMQPCMACQVFLQEKNSSVQKIAEPKHLISAQTELNLILLKGGNIKATLPDLTDRAATHRHAEVSTKNLGLIFFLNFQHFDRHFDLYPHCLHFSSCCLVVVPVHHQQSLFEGKGSYSPRQPQLERMTWFHAIQEKMSLFHQSKVSFELFFQIMMLVILCRDCFTLCASKLCVPLPFWTSCSLFSCGPCVHIGISSG
mmetsp:Transcript_68424/g.101614  ORF Transcript_68424/g.101614 Transcript_68424/m.101614 type:complete len:200 (+) Transcript_68424:779-1378(+)